MLSQLVVEDRCPNGSVVKFMISIGDDHRLQVGALEPHRVRTMGILLTVVEANAAVGYFRFEAKPC